MAEIRLSELFAFVFRPVWKLIKINSFTHYWFKGGRGSTKSSFISLCIVLLIISDPEANAVSFRKVGDTLRTSVYEQILWAIDMLELSDYFDATTNPMEIVYRPTGQKILFRGLDDARKTKSIKLRKGKFKIIWFEELDEFNGMEEIRKALQSLMRGAQQYWCFYSYNPPINTSNWVNQEAEYPQSDRYVHHSTYLDVPKEWLGEKTIIEAEHLKKKDPRAYEHEYLGKAVGTGGSIFRNVIGREIADAEINQFDNLRYGIDFGYVADPFAWIRMHYDKTRRKLYIFDEIFKLGLLNIPAFNHIKEKLKGIPLYSAKHIGDSASPQNIDELKGLGLRIVGVNKAHSGNAHETRQFSVKWLQGLDEIIIDPVRCPNAYREFSTWELEKNRDGSWKDDVPDKNDHSIDAVRYALSEDMKRKSFL